MSGLAKGKGKADIPTATDSESLSATEIDADLNSDDEDEVDETSLMCVIWIVKSGQRKPLVSTSLMAIKLFTMTFDEAIDHLNKKVSSICSAKYTADSTIAYQAKPCKVASKAHELPKGFPNCIGFSTCDTEDAYDS